ncbi:Vegetative incompatibility protein HET-E-1 [Cercospora beticola]|uniref:Vegetative incompatibility protein HET-E-1 n=1 Tax=Cercospora beticola TaxID=122368 RepID=A0A2G5HPN5_CERBT|nr:Vegetative incompatibility protein HET-E-1 [Cercospora beticola]PIA94511.1 Vegetative incompatibility protein HET-E-1 [Cercospora beticola]WPB05070.1 hypothetical protein RHO25_009720 [Cercospora beticola]CAK1364852.1 unnamed protein product [Cercospora beticola]
MSIRLLNVNTLELEEFSGANAPEYVIASHRWVGDECTYKDVLKKRNTHKAGYKKIEAFCAFVRQVNLAAYNNGPDLRCDWLWIDTACIDKSNSQEVQRAINSMFKYYSEAVCCFAFLADLKALDHPSGRHAVKESFYNSEWFTRGWTLQELLAPQTVVFLTSIWEVYGHKCTRVRPGSAQISRCPGAGDNLNARVSEITGIPQMVLYDFSSSKALSVEERMAWTRNRQTKEREDMSYCLLGIFDVYMNLKYGEGKERARWRLEDEIETEKKHQPLRRNDTDSFSVAGPRRTPAPCTVSLLSSAQPANASRPDSAYASNSSRRSDVPIFQATVQDADEEPDHKKEPYPKAPSKDPAAAQNSVKRGLTRFPKRLVRREALDDLNYVYTEEENKIIIPLALGKAHIDELLRLSESYNNMKPISYRLKAGDGFTTVEAEMRKASPAQDQDSDRLPRRTKSQTKPKTDSLKPPEFRPRSSSTPKSSRMQSDKKSATTAKPKPTINTSVDSPQSIPGTTSSSSNHSPNRYTLPKSPLQTGMMTIHFQYSVRPPEPIVNSLKRDCEEFGLNVDDIRTRTKDSIERTFYEIEIVALYSTLSHRQWDYLIDTLKEVYVYAPEMCAIGFKHQVSFDEINGR